MYIGVYGAYPTLKWGYKGVPDNLCRIGSAYRSTLYNDTCKATNSPYFLSIE